MFSKSFIVPIFLLALTSTVDAHALITPALGVKGNGARSDVQRPSGANPCGNVNIPQNLDTSTPVQAAADGTFSPSITDFNGGADGSRSIKTVQVDVSGTGNNFVDAKMVANGDPNPTSAATQQLTVQLPAGTKCAGGAGKNLCLASFTTTAGFGNCVVVSQDAGAAKTVPKTDPAPSGTDQVTPTTSGAAKGKNPAGKGGANGGGCNGDNSNKGKQAEKPKAESSAMPSMSSQATSTPTGVAECNIRRSDKRAADDDNQANMGRGNARNSSAVTRGNNVRSWSSRKLV